MNLSRRESLRRIMGGSLVLMGLAPLVSACRSGAGEVSETPAAPGVPAPPPPAPPAPDAQGKVKLDDAAWRSRLSPEAYNVLREHGTERSGTSPLNHEKRAGTFVCAGCGAPLFTSADKFESGTGWPSYTRPVDASRVIEHKDTSYGMTRTEVLCARCGGHLGHVFDDGPQPTGLRYCINGVSLAFSPAGAPSP
jgi:peptide-methionine (R)-S-oxide reductase